MQAGVVGLIDLMEYDEVVGTREIAYSLGIETQGGMGIGYVKRDHPAPPPANATYQGVAATVASLAPSSPLSLGGVETGLVGTS